MCNSGVGLTPIVDDKTHWFGVCGIANGLAVMRDEETLSLWDHITGEAFEGPMAGRRLDFWPVFMTTVTAVLQKHPDIKLLPSDYRSLGKSFSGMMHRKKIEARGRMPRFFRKSMSRDVDPRLEAHAQGLGVIVGEEGKYYPMSAIPKGGRIEDDWLERTLQVERNQLDGVLFARWLDSGEVPMQLLTRWYGFSFTYPGCAIYGEPILGS